jgi:hypothetical protein
VTGDLWAAAAGALFGGFALALLVSFFAAVLLGFVDFVRRFLG